MARQIVTHHVYPPISDRSMDWQATWDDFDMADDGPVPLIGRGRTEHGAICDLIQPDHEDWIPVTDALPPRNFLVLASDGDVRWLDKCYPEPLNGWAGRPLSHETSDHLHRQPPTHWTLIPDAPQPQAREPE